MPHAVPTASTTRRPKGDKRSRTRARLIEVAAQLVEEKGYEHASLQEVARRAGMSNGAVYGNFKNREDLLAAIGPTYWPQVRPHAPPGASLAEVMRAIAAALIEVMPARTRMGVGRLRGLAYVLGSDAMLARAAELAARRSAAAVSWWRERFPDGTQLPMPADELVAVISALTEGLTFQRLAAPDLITDRVIFAAFAALAGERPRPE